MVKYYRVGGSVRDSILGIKSKDIDYAVEANSYEEMKEDLLLKGVFIYQERPEFFAIRGNHPEWGPVDFTLCRTDGFYSDSRHPDHVEIGTIYDDLARRDFTVNAIAIDEDGNTIDPHGGIEDIQNNILRCVGTSVDRFNEDPLRMLRAIRFHIVRGFDLDEHIRYDLAHSTVPYSLVTVSKERVYEELNKCFEHNSWQTLQFFHNRPYLEKIIFKVIGINLIPKVAY